MVTGAQELEHVRQQREQKIAFGRATVSFDVDIRGNLTDLVSRLQGGRQGDAHKATVTGFDGKNVPVEYRPYSVGDALAKGVDKLIAVEYKKRLTNTGRIVRGLHIILPNDTSAKVAKVYDVERDDISFAPMRPLSPYSYVTNLVGDNGIAMSGTPAGTILDVTVSVFQRAPFEAEIPGERTRVPFLRIIR